MIVGIDLGTTNTSICYYKNGRPFFIKDLNNHNISSIIGITTYGNVFGNQSKTLTDNNIFISNIKRLIGYKYDELPTSYYDQFSYKIINDNNNIKIKLEQSNSQHSPEEIMTYFLNYLKTLINNEMLSNVYKVIVTVPAYFSIKQKETIKSCIFNAGLDCLKLINEPTSAAISYGSFINFKTDDKILIFDLGGGTLDLSIVNIENEDGELLYEVLGTYGNNKCGGSDLTFLLIDFIKMKYDSCSFNNNNMFEHVDKMKILLSNGADRVSSEVNLTNSIDCNIVIDSEEFEVIVDMWLEKINLLESVQNVLQIAKTSKENICYVLLVGAATKLKKINEILSNYFNKIIKEYFVSNIRIEDIAVSHGAALHGHTLNTSKSLILVDVCPFTIGIETLNKTSEFANDNETIGGIMAPIIPRNSPIPISRTQQFTTDKDDTTSVAIKIFQGESKLVENNIYLGEFVLNDIMKAPKGVPVINVNIMIDHSGLLKITACDRKNFTTSQIIISAKDYKMSEEDSELIRMNMLKNKDEETTLFDLIDVYHNFLPNYERLIFNLIVNPINNFDSEYIENIKDNMRNKITKLCTCIHLNNLPISFKSFYDLTELLYEDENMILNESSIYNNLLVYIRLLFYDLHTYIINNYGPLTSGYDEKNNVIHNSMDNRGTDITEENIGSSNVKSDLLSKCNMLKANLHSSNIRNILEGKEMNETEFTELNEYKIITLLEELLNIIDEIGLNIMEQNELLTYIDKVQNNMKEYTLEDINIYCETILANGST